VTDASYQHCYSEEYEQGQLNSVRLDLHLATACLTICLSRLLILLHYVVGYPADDSANGCAPYGWQCCTRCGRQDSGYKEDRRAYCDHTQIVYDASHDWV